MLSRSDGSPRCSPPPASLRLHRRRRCPTPVGGSPTARAGWWSCTESTWSTSCRRTTRPRRGSATMMPRSSPASASTPCASASSGRRSSPRPVTTTVRTSPRSRRRCERWRATACCRSSTFTRTCTTSSSRARVRPTGLSKPGACRISPWPAFRRTTLSIPPFSTRSTSSGPTHQGRAEPDSRIASRAPGRASRQHSSGRRRCSATRSSTSRGREPPGSRVPWPPAARRSTSSSKRSTRASSPAFAPSTAARSSGTSRTCSSTTAPTPTSPRSVTRAPGSPSMTTASRSRTPGRRRRARRRTIRSSRTPWRGRRAPMMR